MEIRTIPVKTIYCQLRYVLVDNETGEILADAGVYGFETPQKAYDENIELFNNSNN